MYANIMTTVANTADHIVDRQQQQQAQIAYTDMNVVDMLKAKRDAMREEGSEQCTLILSLAHAYLMTAHAEIRRNADRYYSHAFRISSHAFIQEIHRSQ